MQSRFAKISDSEQISQLLDELIEEVNFRGAPPAKTALNLKERTKMFDSLLKREDVKIFVMEEDNKIIAFSDVFIIPVMRRSIHTAIIEDFVVTKTRRGQGIGTKLMQSIIAYCREQNIHVIKLTSGIELISAHKFYEKMGGKYSEKLFRFDI